MKCEGCNQNIETPPNLRNGKVCSTCVHHKTLMSDHVVHCLLFKSDVNRTRVCDKWEGED